MYDDLIKVTEEDLNVFLDYLVKDQKLMRFFVMILNSMFSDFPKEKVVDSWKISQVLIFSHSSNP